jgi:hypothetical protein
MADPKSMFSICFVNTAKVDCHKNRLFQLLDAYVAISPTSYVADPSLTLGLHESCSQKLLYILCIGKVHPGRSK